MVSKRFIRILLSGFLLMFVAFIGLYSFTITQKNLSEKNDETVYLETLETNMNMMAQLELDETMTLQKYSAGKITNVDAHTEVLEISTKRQKLEDTFFSRISPETFLQVHNELREANKLWIQADALYAKGSLENKNNFILDADVKVEIAKQKLASAKDKLTIVNKK